MLYDMMFASLIGTLISVCVAYLFAYRKEILGHFFNRSRGEWGDTFETLVREQKKKIGGASEQARAGTPVGASRQEKVIPLFLKTLKQLESGENKANSPGLLKNWQEYATRIYLGGSNEFKSMQKEWERNKSTPLSAAFFKRLMGEMLDQNHAFKNVSKKELRSLRDFECLTFAIASLLLLIEDAEKGSRTLSKQLIKNQTHERRVFLAIEYWIFLKAGAAKSALISELTKANHPVGRRISSLSYSKRVYLCYQTLITDWAHLPDQKALLASFVKIMDEFSSLEAEEIKKEHKREERNQKKKEKQQHQGHSKKASRSLSKTDDYLMRLGLPKGSDFKSVRKAYKKLAMEKHPDRLMGNSPSELELKRAHTEFLQIQEAYQYLEKQLGGAKKSA